MLYGEYFEFKEVAFLYFWDNKILLSEDINIGNLKELNKFEDSIGSEFSIQDINTYCARHRSTKRQMEGTVNYAKYWFLKTRRSPFIGGIIGGQVLKPTARGPKDFKEDRKHMEEWFKISLSVYHSIEDQHDKMEFRDQFYKSIKDFLEVNINLSHIELVEGYSLKVKGLTMEVHNIENTDLTGDQSLLNESQKEEIILFHFDKEKPRWPVVAICLVFLKKSAPASQVKDYNEFEIGIHTALDKDKLSTRLYANYKDYSNSSTQEKYSDINKKNLEKAKVITDLILEDFEKHHLI